MPFTRKDLWRLGNDWNDEMLWYARAVADLQSRPIGDATSWGYLAAMHGFDPQLWQAFGYLAPGTRPPSTAGRDWDQCQHQSWFFLPWHRGYLWSFESIVRASIIKQGGPADWALPYWNYNNPANANARTLPLSLTAATLPDGSQNPLAPDRRYGANGRGQINLNPAAIALASATKISGTPSRISSACHRAARRVSAARRRRSITAARTTHPTACSRACRTTTCTTKWAATGAAPTPTMRAISA